MVQNFWKLPSNVWFNLKLIVSEETLALLPVLTRTTDWIDKIPTVEPNTSSKKIIIINKMILNYILLYSMVIRKASLSSRWIGCSDPQTYRGTKLEVSYQFTPWRPGNPLKEGENDRSQR